MFASYQSGTRLRIHFLVALALVGLQAGAAAEQTSPDQWPLDAWRLDDVAEIARRNRAEVSVANARAEALAQRPAIVAALEDPMIAPSIDHYPFDMPEEQSEMGEADGGRRYDWSVSVEQRFPLSGVRGHRKAAAQADAQRAQALAHGTELDVVLDAQRSFFMLLERRRMRRVLEEQMILARQVVSASSSRYASGVGLQADVLRAEVEVARVQATQQALSAQIRASEAMLNASLGRESHERIPELVYVPNRDMPLPAAAAVDRALQGRPELVAGESEVKRAAAEMEVMRSMYKPMAMIRLGRATTMAEGPGAMIMIGISVPIWRDRLRAGVAEARAMQRMADADLVAMRRMVEGEAAAASESVSAARSQLVVLEDEVMPRARAANEAALATYSSGQGTLVSVIESARALWDVQAEQVMAEATLGEAWARLSRATAKVQERQP
jgi:cobalt-zinc-cadmium efflux system outer membrane protein